MKTYWVSKDCIECIVGASRDFIIKNRKFNSNNEPKKQFVKITIFENLEESKFTKDDTEPSTIIELG